MNIQQLSKSEIENIREIKLWFIENRGYNNALDYSKIIQKNCTMDHTIIYKNINCSNFIWLTIVHYNYLAAVAIKKSLKNVDKYLKDTYKIVLYKYSHPLAIHFALLSINTDLWDELMFKYFEIVDIENLTPGCIVSWIFESFINNTASKFTMEERNTGHIGCISSILQNRRVKMCHSVSRIDDPKNNSGPTETNFTLDGYIFGNIARGKIPGGALRFK